VETKAHLCFLKKVGGCCGCVYGTKGAGDQKSLGTTALDDEFGHLNFGTPLMKNVFYEPKKITL
jgi:hypothetical protein